MSRLVLLILTAAGVAVAPLTTPAGPVRPDPRVAAFQRYEGKWAGVTKPDWEAIVTHVHGADPGDEDSSAYPRRMFRGYAGRSLTDALGPDGERLYTAAVTVVGIPAVPTAADPQPKQDYMPDLMSHEIPLILIVTEARTGPLGGEARNRLRAVVAYAGTRDTTGVAYAVTTADATVPAAGDDSPVALADERKVGLYRSVAEVRSARDRAGKWTFEVRVGAAKKLGKHDGTVHPLDAPGPAVPIRSR